MEGDRFEHLLDFVKSKSPDVLCLLELNGWHEDDYKRLNEFKEKAKYGFHSFALSNKGYHLGLFSRKKIIHAKSHNKGFNHALLEFSIKHNKERIFFYLTHLTPKSHRERIKEVEYVLDVAKTQKKSIILGDLNALSPNDNYNKKELMETLKKNNVTKFGISKVSIKTIQRIHRNKFYDSFKQNSKEGFTVPTKMCTDYNHCSKLRLDYIFVSKGLRRRIKDSLIINEDAVHKISDHFPISLTLK